MADSKYKRTSVVLTSTIRQDIERISNLSGGTQSRIIQVGLALGLVQLRELMPSLLGTEQRQIQEIANDR